MYIEHKFMTFAEAKEAQRRLKKIYGYTPEIFKVTDPFLGFTFFMVVEPIIGVEDL
jgi:hypothetical protein